MKSKLKGFTLVELIVVMAIMSLLMLGIMQMFKPIRTIYVDSTQYEAQRTAQSGVVQYITESVRYATDIGIYDETAASTASDAVDAFATAYCTANSIDSTKETDVKEAIKKNAEVIIIDNKTKHYSKDYTGRLIRRKVDGTDNSVGSPSFIGTNNIVDTTSKWRTALGEAYYGENTYYITFDTSGSANGMLIVNVASTRNGKRDISQLHYEQDPADPTNSIFVDESIKVTNNITRGGVLCRNLVGSTNNGVNKVGIYDIDYTASSSQNAYIVFLNGGTVNRSVTPPKFTGKKAVEEAAK